MKIEKININDTQVTLSNLIVIVGPNGSGKTTFLRNLYESFLTARPNGVEGNESRKWSGIIREDSLSVSVGEWQTWARSLVVVPGSSGATGGTGLATPHYLARQHKSTYVDEHTKKVIDATLVDSNYTDDQKEKALGNSAANQAFRDQQSVYLSVDDRFYVSGNSQGAVQYDQMNSMNVVSFLVKHPEALRRIDSSLIAMFKKSLRVETPTFPNYHLVTVPKSSPSMRRLSQTTEGFLKQHKVYDVWFSKNAATLLRDEGHGIRAALEILYGLELDSNKIVFLDEPELHLYPATKYTLGQLIAGYTNGNNKKQVILVTHDADMLAGLLHVAKNATIIRINKDRSITTTSSAKIRQTSQHDFLEGAFLDAAILVEGVDDAYVYNGVFRLKKVLPDYSYNFVPCHGKDRMADNLTVYQNLKIPFAMVVDFDVLYSDKRRGVLIESYLQALNIDKAIFDSIEDQLVSVRTAISSRSNKKKGLNMDGLTAAERNALTKLLGNLAKVGIFVVPIGELEDWVGASKAESSPNDIVGRFASASNTKYLGLTEFINRVGCYIRSEIENSRS